MTDIVIRNQDREDLIEYIKDHIKHFNAIPIEFETAGGYLIPYATIWQVAEQENLFIHIN